MGIDELINGKIYNIRVFLEDLKTTVRKVGIENVHNIRYEVNYHIPAGKIYGELKLVMSYIHENNRFVDTFYYAFVKDDWIRMVKK